jgi:hypothetical protein
MPTRLGQYFKLFHYARRYRVKLLDFTMAESDPKITIEQTPTSTNNEDMSNIVYEDISDCSNSVPVERDCSNSVPVERLDYSKEGSLIRVSMLLTVVFSASELAFLDFDGELLMTTMAKN